MMPAQRPHKSRQNYATPWEFVVAVEARFGPLAFDLAAEDGTCKVRNDPSAYFGPGGVARDSLAQDWTKLEGNLWLNPPFGAIEEWARKCEESAREGRRILFLVPASVGTNWHANHIDGKARVYFLRPRLCFDGIAPFPKDLMLVFYGDEPGYECWNWAPKKEKKPGPGLKKTSGTRSAVARRAAETRRESEERVTVNLSAELLPLWTRVRSQFQSGTPHERFEAFMQYVEEHPEEALIACAEDAESKLDAWALGQSRDPEMHR